MVTYGDVKKFVNPKTGQEWPMVQQEQGGQDRVNEQKKQAQQQQQQQARPASVVGVRFGQVRPFAFG